MLPQEAEKGNEGQPEHGRVLPLDPAEELRAESLKAVGADAREGGVTLKVKVSVEERIRESAHGQARPCEMAPDLAPVPVADERSLKRVGLVAQGLQVRPGFGERGGLSEPALGADEDLIGADHENVRVADALRLETGEEERRIAWVRALGLRCSLDRVLVDAGGPGLEVQPGIPQHGGARRGLAREDQARPLSLQHDALHTARARARCFT